MDFSDALRAMKEGKTVTRAKWSKFDTGIVIKAQFPDENSKMTMPYIYMIKGKKSLGDQSLFPVPLSCESIFAEDWEVRE